MNRAAIIAALSAYRIIRGSGVSEPLRAVDVQGIADAIMEADKKAPVPTGPYRAEFGAIHHAADPGFLFTVAPDHVAPTIAQALNVYAASQGDRLK